MNKSIVVAALGGCVIGAVLSSLGPGALVGRAGAAPAVGSAPPSPAPATGPGAPGRNAPGAPAAAPVPCPQWETTLAPPSITTSASLPQYGKVTPMKGPEGGWEPFAFSPSGQLVFRRCVGTGP